MNEKERIRKLLKGATEEELDDLIVCLLLITAGLILKVKEEEGNE